MLYPPNEVLDFLKECVAQAVININEKIPRIKSGTTPIKVLHALAEEQKEKREKYKKKKMDERRETQKKGGTFKEKVRKGFNKIIKHFSDEKVFAIGELLNHRFQFLKT